MTPTSSRRFLCPALALAWLGAATLPAPAGPEVLPPPAAASAAPAVRHLTLEEARQLALANNKALALARINIEEKRYGTAAARKDYLPKVLGSVSYFHFNDDLGSVVTFQRGRLGILPVGATTINAAVFNENSTLSTIFLAQPITKLIAVNAAVQAARADEATARARLDKGTRDLLSGVAQAYHGLLGAQRIQTALELQVRLLEQAGGASPPPPLRVALVEARQGLAQVRGQVQELTDQLNDLLGLPPCTVLELVDPLPPEPALGCAEDAAQLAVAHSPEVREAEQGVAKAEAGLKISRLQYVPDVNVIGGYANQTVASYIQPNIGYVGITASYTFWDWGKRRDVNRQSQTLIALAQQNVLVVMDKVRLEARKAYGAFVQARDAFRLAAEMVQARKAAEKAATGPAAAQAKGETAKAELEYMKAEIAYRVAHAQLTALICPE